RPGVIPVTTKRPVASALTSDGAIETTPSAWTGRSETRIVRRSAGGRRRSAANDTLPDSVRPGWSERLTPETRSPSTRMSADAHWLPGVRASSVYCPGETLLNPKLSSAPTLVVLTPSDGTSGNVV